MKVRELINTLNMLDEDMNLDVIGFDSDYKNGGELTSVEVRVEPLVNDKFIGLRFDM